MAGNQSFRLNPALLARYEAGSWRAYYDRRWPELLRLVVALCQAQFHIPFPASLLAAYHATRGAIAWAPVDHDLGRVQAYYEKFYRMASRYSGLGFDPAAAAALETRWNDDHRRLVFNPDKSEFIETLTQLHALLFGLTAEQARPSAELRVLANNTVDLISNHISTDVPGDWAKLEDYLRRCYESIQDEMDANRSRQDGALQWGHAAQTGPG